MLKQIFWSGIKAFVPIALTLTLIVWVLRSIESFFGYFIKLFINPEYYFDGLGVIVGLITVMVIGVLVNAWLINKIYAFTDSTFKRIPLVKTLYNAFTDLMKFFDSNRQQQQQRAVLLETALGNVVGFVTQEVASKVSSQMGKDEDVIVYLPLSYQIGGLMIVIPKSKLKPLDVPVSKAMSMVLTAGMTGLSADKNTTSAAKVSSAAKV